MATGWTECLPLLYQSQETVLAAIQRARSLFPFPLLGIDTDNGGEFINDLLVTYCEHEHLTSHGAARFRELQRLSPGRYQPLHIRTLQRGMRKIRAFFLETANET